MAMIRPETEMKDSGIEYVGAIPKDWDLVRLRAYFGERKNKNKDGNETNLLSLSYGRIIRKNIDKTDGLLPASFNTYNIVEKNDIIIRPTDLQNDKRSLRTGLVTEHGIITSAYIDLMPIGNIDSRFVHYLLRSYDILKVFYNMGSGVRQGLNYSEFSKLKVPMPLLSEQQTIADYLDETCSKIDKIIAEAKASIDEYKELKQSKIDYILSNDTYPRIRIKYVASIYGRIGFRGYTTGDMVNEGEGAITLSPSNLENGLMKYTRCSYISWEKYNESPEIMIKLNDVLMVKTGSSYGKVALVDVLPLEATINPQLIVFKNIKGDNKYFSYCMQSTMVQNQIAHIVSGGTIPTLSQEKIKNMKIYYPPLLEQIEIVKYLDRETAEIDSLISEKESLINDLEAYKKSLIYEVVTGKRRAV